MDFLSVADGIYVDMLQLRKRIMKRIIDAKVKPSKWTASFLPNMFKRYILADNNGNNILSNYNYEISKNEDIVKALINTKFDFDSLCWHSEAAVRTFQDNVTAIFLMEKLA